MVRLPLVIFTIKLPISYIRAFFSNDRESYINIGIKFILFISISVISIGSYFFLPHFLIILEKSNFTFIPHLFGVLLNFSGSFNIFKATKGIGTNIQNIALNKVYLKRIPLIMCKAHTLIDSHFALSLAKIKHYQFFKGIPKIPCKDYSFLPNYTSPLYEPLKFNKGFF